MRNKIKKPTKWRADKRVQRIEHSQLTKIPLRKWDKRQHSWTSTDPQTHKLARRARTDIQAFFPHVSILHQAELVWPLFKASHTGILPMRVPAMRRGERHYSKKGWLWIFWNWNIQVLGFRWHNKPHQFLFRTTTMTETQTCHSKEHQRYRVGIKITREKRWITYKVTQPNRE